MTRPYGVKSRKRTKGEKYDHEEDEEAAKVESSDSDEEETPAEETQDAATVSIVEGIPIAPSERNTDKSKIIFVLERASLEVAKVGKVLILRLIFLFYFSLCNSFRSSYFRTFRYIQMLKLLTLKCIDTLLHELYEYISSKFWLSLSVA